MTAIIKREGEGPIPIFFPQSENYPWNVDNFRAAVEFRAKGSTVDLTVENLPLVPADHRNYEGNKLEIKDWAFISTVRRPTNTRSRWTTTS